MMLKVDWGKTMEDFETSCSFSWKPTLAKRGMADCGVDHRIVYSRVAPTSPLDD